MQYHPQGRVLVIKHGALGDIFKILGGFEAVRNHFPQAEITLLTAPSYIPVMQKTGYFDHILSDPRRKNPIALARLLYALHQKSFDSVIDCQFSERSSYYCRLLYLLAAGKPRVFRCSAPQEKPPQQRVFEILRQLGSCAAKEDVQNPNCHWLDQHRLSFAFQRPRRYALLIPGSAGGKGQKRLPPASYGYIARLLVGQGVTPVLIGCDHEREANAQIHAMAPSAINVTSQTQIEDIYTLARDADFCVGNDTGPLYVALCAGRPTGVFWSDYSAAAVHAPQGEQVFLFHHQDLRAVPPQALEAAIQKLLGGRDGT